jgi:hypothetical protein
MPAFYMTRSGLAAAAFLTTAAAWLSQGTLAVSSLDGSRIGLLPVSLSASATALAAGATVVGFARTGASLAPIWLLTFVVWPWVPVPMPAAILVWSGPIRWLIWTAVVIAMLVTVLARRLGQGLPFVVTLVRDRPRSTAGALAFAIFAFAAWQVSPSVPGGDEPHYLVITQSLLLDGDLKIENNHTRGDYQAYYGGRLAPHYVRRGADGEIYSIHAPGVSALVAPAFAIGGYRGAVLWLVVIAACGSALAWHVSSLASGQPSAAWFGWAAVTLSATTIFHSFAVYPDSVGGVIVLSGVWALLRADSERRSGGTRVWPWFLHGAALAILPWLHSRFAVLAGSLGALVLLRLSSTSNPAGKAVAFLSIPAVSAIGWMGFFVAIYGVADPSAPYGTGRDFAIAFIPGGLTGLLFDQRFGLLANAPVLAVGVAGLVTMLRRPHASAGLPSAGRADRRLAIELLFVMVPYLLTATSYAMWWGGSSAPARFASPAVLILAIPCAVAWQVIRNRATRVIAAGSLALTGFLSSVLVVVGGGRLAYNSRESTAQWLEWASPLTALGEGMPAWYRDREAGFAVDVAVWVTALALAWWCSRRIAAARSVRDRGRLVTAVAAIHLAAAMLAVATVWRIHGVDGVLAAPAELDMLRVVAAEPRVMALQVSPPRRLATTQLLERLTLESAVRTPGRTGRSTDPTVAAFPSMPAGRYRLRLEGGGAAGWLMLGIGPDQFAFRSEALVWPQAPIDIEFPVAVRALIVRGDEDARRAIRRVIVEPLSIVPSSARLTDLVSRRAVKYEGATVFFLDDGSFAEPEAFWIGGSRQSALIVQPDRPGPSIDLLLRNAPVDNRVTLHAGQWRDELTLAPGEDRRVLVPVAPGQRAVLLTAATTSGFRPSESTPGSKDDRFLGVWVKPGSRIP